jgi:hypothetical protein
MPLFIYVIVYLFSCSVEFLTHPGIEPSQSWMALSVVHLSCSIHAQHASRNAEALAVSLNIKIQNTGTSHLNQRMKLKRMRQGLMFILR